MPRKEKHIILHDVEISDYAAEGKSLARIDGKVIFVEGAIPGDIVDVQLRKSKKDWAEGRVIHFRKFSAQRVEPFCSHFGICGGCQWQMLPYPQQLLFKQKQVADNLERIGKTALPAIEPIVGALQQTRYRNKIEYTFGTRRFLLPRELNDPSIRADQPVAGFHAKGIFDKLVNIDTCYLQEEPSNELRLAIRDYAIAHNLSFYDIRQHAGWIRTMQVRTTTAGEVMLNLVFGHDQEEDRIQLMDFIIGRFPKLHTLIYTINPKWNDSLYDLEPVVVKGPGYLVERMEDFKFKIGPKSFFQTNTTQGEQLYKMVREFAELSGIETVYDLYCGTGTIGIFLSKGAKKIIGVETVEEAVDDARANALLNDIPQASFFAGDVIRVCNDEFFVLHGRPDVIVTDPPRAGMHEKLVEKLLDMEAPVIVYVSCNPATQARDLNLLDEKYAVTRIRPIDMFPHTHHIENVVQLKLRKSQ